MFRKICSLVLVFCMLFVTNASAFNALKLGDTNEIKGGDTLLSQNEKILSHVSEGGDTLVLSEEITEEGYIIRSYYNGKLSEQVLTPKESDGYIYQTLYTADGREENKLKISDYIEVTQIKVIEDIQPYATQYQLGEITYEYYANGTHIAVAQVAYSMGKAIQTEYTIYGGTYTTATLISLLISGLGVVGTVATGITGSIIAALGLAATVATITIVTPCTMSAVKTPYTFHLTEKGTSHKNTFTSDKYVINSETAKYKPYFGKIYYDEYNPNGCWRDINFGTRVYLALFPYTSWSIVKWS